VACQKSANLQAGPSVRSSMQQGLRLSLTRAVPTPASGRRFCKWTAAGHTVRTMSDFAEHCANLKIQHTRLHVFHYTHTYTRLTALSPGLPGESRYQKGKTNLDFTEATDSEWQWHQLGHMQVCISLQTDNHASTPPLSFYRLDALPAAQPKTSKHWRQHYITYFMHYTFLDFPR